MVETIYSYYTENEAGTTITLNREDLGDDEMKELRTAIREGLPEIPGVRIVFEEEIGSHEHGSATHVVRIDVHVNSHPHLNPLNIVVVYPNAIDGC